MRLYVILNPMARQGAAGKQRDQLEACLQANKLDYTLVETERPGHAIILSQQAAAAGYDGVVAAGGDGTCNEVINGLMLAGSGAADRPALGVLPVGRGNDFSFGMGIPPALEQACALLAGGASRVIDVGQVFGGNFPLGRYFGNGIGLGFDTVVGFEAARMKHLKGALSYLVAVVKTIFLYHHAPVYEVTFDGEMLRQPFLMVSVMNGRRMGGSFMMAPSSDPGDGLLDLCLVGKVSQPGIIGLVPHFIRGTQASRPQVRMARARQIQICAVDGTIPAHADGETVCTQGLEVRAKLIPAALKLFSPVK